MHNYFLLQTIKKTQKENHEYNFFKRSMEFIWKTRAIKAKNNLSKFLNKKKKNYLETSRIKKTKKNIIRKKGDYTSKIFLTKNINNNNKNKKIYQKKIYKGKYVAPSIINLNIKNEKNKDLYKNHQLKEIIKKIYIYIEKIHW